MPSASMTRVSVRRASSSSRARSAEDRASRETSSPKIAPTSPRHTRATSSWNPARRSRRPARHAQVGVDHLHRWRPSPAGRLVGQGVLAGGRLGVLADLRQRGLADVDDRGPFPMVGGDLLGTPHRRPPTPRGHVRPPPPTASATKSHSAQRPTRQQLDVERRDLLQGVADRVDSPAPWRTASAAAAGTYTVRVRPPWRGRTT